MTEQFILTLIDRFSASGLRELRFDEGGSSLTLSKNTLCQSEAAPSAGHPASAGSDAGARAAEAGGAPGKASGGEYVCAPLVGTFYAAPGPDSPAFVSKGGAVKKGDTLCIIEAMKMMNKLEADFDCEIIAVKAAPGELVEFGQPLFEVKRL